MPQGPRLNLTHLTTLRALVRRGTLAAAAEHLGTRNAASLTAEARAVAVATGATSDSVADRDYVEIEALRDTDWILPPETFVRHGWCLQEGASFPANVAT